MLTLVELACLVVPAGLVVAVGVAWHLSDRVLGAVASWVIGWLVGRYVFNPEGYGRYVGILRDAALPHLGSLLPHLSGLRPVLAPLLGTVTTEGTTAKRVGDYIAVEYRYRDSAYTALHPYTNGSEIRHAMALTRAGEWEDVTARVRRYAGPCGDFHGQRVRPVDIVRDCRELHVSYGDDVLLTVSEEDVIDVAGRSSSYQSTYSPS
jgi:hypothetical protein